jgi:hypothetical protein
MSLRAIQWVWDHSVSRGSRRLVLLAMADWADNANQCYPSIRTLALKSTVSEMTAHRAIKELVGLGEIRREKRFVERRMENDCNLFTFVHLALPEKVSPPAAVSSEKRIEDRKTPRKFTKMERWQIAEEMKMVRSRIKVLSEPGSIRRTDKGWLPGEVPAGNQEIIKGLRKDLAALQSAFDHSSY